MDTILDQIRTAAARVAGEARHVAIDRARMSTLAEDLTALPSAPLGHEADCHLLVGGEATAAFFVILDTINFGSGWFPVLRKEPGRSGYFTIAKRLTSHFRAKGVWSAREMAVLTPARIAVILGQEENPAVEELLTLYARALRDLGSLLESRYAGQPVRLIEAAGGGAARLVELLAVMPFFQDSPLHGGRPAPIYKRAQLMAADLALAFGGTGWGHFHDRDRLTIFADNLVPHVLRWEGVLHFDPLLAQRIDSGIELISGSTEEVEMRACAIHAVELMTAHLRSRALPQTASTLDFHLWNRGQLPHFKAHPRPRCRCVYY